MLHHLLQTLLGVQNSPPVHQEHDGSFWFPQQASTLAAGSDWLFDFILCISLFFFVLILGLMMAFVWRYRRRPNVRASFTTTHHTPLELTWTIIPTILVVIIYYFGISGYIDARTPPRNAHEVQATAQKWSWNFTYPNGVVDCELHVPVNTATRVTMRSEDVIHSLFIPAFRMKLDVVPGRYNKMTFTPTKEGRYQIFCAEYCGTGHSRMTSVVTVQSQEAYEAYLREMEEKTAKMDPVALGGDLYKTRGCMQCHSVDGSRGIGPSFKGVWGRTEHLSDGTSIVVDEDYIHESILEPQAKIVAGFAPVMPTFKGKLNDAQIHAIIEWMKTLK